MMTEFVTETKTSIHASIYFQIKEHPQFMENHHLPHIKKIISFNKKIFHISYKNQLVFLHKKIFL